MRTILLLAGLAFVMGVVVTVALVRYYAGWVAAAPADANGQRPTPSGIAAMFVPPPESDSAPRSPDAQALEARLNVLSGRLSGLESRANMVDRDSQTAASNASRAEALLIAFSARRAIDRGLSLGYLEGQLRSRFGGIQPRAVVTIIDASRKPVTVEDLRLGLDTIAPQLTTGGTSAGWWPSFRRELNSLIIIRKEGTPSPRPADRLARIRRMLDARQVEAAVAEVARMPGGSQAGAWSAAANRYVAAHHALDLIETMAIIGSGGQDPALVMPQPMSAQPAPARSAFTGPAVTGPAMTGPATAGPVTTGPAPRPNTQKAGQ